MTSSAGSGGVNSLVNAIAPGERGSNLVYIREACRLTL